MLKSGWLMGVLGMAMGVVQTASAADKPWAPQPAPAKAAPAAPAARSASTAAPTPAGSKLEWTQSFVQATKQARQSDKIILAYFQGSDWCEWCMKLDREVLQTPMFVEWAKENVIPLSLDYPSGDVKQSRALAKQNEFLAATYNVAKLPTLLFLDADGEVIDRAGYDLACLRTEEKKGAPLQAMAKFTEILKSRPTGQQMTEYAFLEAVEKTNKNGLPLLLMIVKPESKLAVATRDRLLKSTRLARFVNTNMAFVNLTWPDDGDVSTQAKWFRTFTEANQIGPAPFQLVVMTYGARKVQHKIMAVDQVDGLVNQLAQQLPNFDYNGGWITDYRKAQSIAAQSQRDLLISFTAMDSSEFCQKMDAEIYQQEAFKEYARKNLVLLQIDFPTKTELSAALKTQNQSLAEQYNIKGYPFILLINPKGQKIGTAKYMPGGAEAFIKELDELRRREFDRRTLASEQVEVQKKK